LLGYRSENNLLDHQNNFVEILKMMNNTVKNFCSLATNLSVLYNYLDRSTKLFFWSVFSKNVGSFSKTIFFVYTRHIVHEN